jgi:hypothetical protein
MKYLFVLSTMTIISTRTHVFLDCFMFLLDARLCFLFLRCKTLLYVSFSWVWFFRYETLLLDVRLCFFVFYSRYETLLYVSFRCETLLFCVYSRYETLLCVSFRCETLRGFDPNRTIHPDGCSLYPGRHQSSSSSWNSQSRSRSGHNILPTF